MRDREDVEIEAEIKAKEGIMNEGCRLPVAAGNGKETDSPLEPPEGMPPCQLLGFNPKNCYGLLTSRAAREYTSIVLNLCICGHPLW